MSVDSNFGETVLASHQIIYETDGNLFPTMTTQTKVKKF